jgi:hypothetical protein
LTNFADDETYNKAITRRFTNHYQFDYFTEDEAMEFVRKYLEKYRDLTFSKDDLEDIKSTICNADNRPNNALSLSYVTDLIFKKVYSKSTGS